MTSRRDINKGELISYGVIRHGYRFVYTPNHRRRSKRGYYAEHRLIFEKFYNCCLLPWGDVHHKDGNRLNNSIDNLEGMTKSNHIRQHFTKDKSNWFCLFCHSETTYRNKKTNRYYWYEYNNGHICSNCHNKIVKK